MPTAEAYFQQAFAAHRVGDVANAERGYRLALALDRQHGPSLHMLGVMLAQQGRYADAAESLRRAARRMPHDFSVHNNLGNALVKVGEHADALRAFDRALALAPGHAQVLNNRGNALYGLGRYADAIDSYRAAIEREPRYGEAMANLAKALLQTGQSAEALRWAEQAVALAPNRPAPHVAKGWALLELGKPSEGALAVGQWLVQDDNHAEALWCRGQCCAALGHDDLAYEAYARAYALEPKLPGVLEGLADAAARTGRLDEARRLAAVLRQEGERDPARLVAALLVQSHALDWTDYIALRDRACQIVRAGQPYRPHPFAILQVVDDPMVQRQVARDYTRVAGYAGNNGGEAAWPEPQSGRIRVAYLSADFREHPTTRLAAATWEAHTRQGFEWVGVYLGPALDPQKDPLHARAMQAFDRFEVITDLDDEAAVQRLRELHIDIAVDLMGFTKYARPGLLARRVAPVQAAYLGYPGTTAMPAIDYLLADRWVAPREAWGAFAEQVVWLPTTYQANNRERVAAAHTPTRAELGLPEAAVVLACFNNPGKIQPETFACWMQVLQQVPGAVLWLLTTHAGVEQALRAHAAQAGVDPARLVFAPKVGHAEHMARHQVADLFLDTWPYNAHTTAADALWMGLPVLTMAGHSFAARVAASLLDAVGLPELITHSPQAYVQRAVALARDGAERDRLRAHLLRARDQAPLFDAALRARELEAAFRQMHERRCQGLPPAPLDVPPQTAG
ncbi:hypothetical protein A9O67_11400 [Tepidimonas fonticaldi]|uniref:protein O-GlcNAc transferase n=1 Tax=Tepidimonas fonticaldi TaxID=1101373 RepID=A0A1A6DY81_9BURK|nr:hypothetical protein A9O67_11400 [Tepidimonas fonticaldi]